MNWNRGGQQQRAKVQEQYALMGPDPRLTIMMKNGFVIGKGLGDGKGRLGAPWGLQGRWVRSSTTTTLRTYMVPTMVPLFPAIPGAPFPPHGAHTHPHGGGAGGAEVEVEGVSLLQAVGLPLPGGAGQQVLWSRQGLPEGQGH